MNTVCISIAAETDQQEILISQLSELGAEGFEQTDDRLLAYFNEHTFQSYEVNQLLQGRDLHTTTITEQNWNAVWESNFQPVVIGDFCGIRAEFHEPIPNVRHELVITPKMSFGTGHHATTHMMVAHMETIDFRGKHVFDFGTGTGILAIMAEKLGAARVSATDIDEWSMENAQENAARNQCSHISLELTDQLPEGNFDIILANINRNVILHYLPALRKILKPGGQILFSGLLTSDEETIREACAQAQLQFVDRSERMNWIALFFHA